MSDIMDYLRWRGDLTLEQDPFNEVDSLILCELVYVDFLGIVPAPGKGQISLQRAGEEIFSRYPLGEKIDMGVVVPDRVPDLFRLMMEAPRYRNMLLSGFVNHVDTERAEQFCAMTVATEDGRIYVVFRGTDDSLAGWQEDLEIACVPQVPAQKMAVQYLEDAARRSPGRKLCLGGHSKGGNLAVYAAVNCSPAVQNRITVVWSFDGPGFYSDPHRLPEYRRIEARVHTIVPKSSVVGMLLEHTEEYTVVDSCQLGLWQHDGFTWQVMRNRFVTLPEVSGQATAGSLALHQRLKSMSPEERGRFVDGLFRILTASGAQTLTDLKEENIRALVPMIRAMKDLDRSTREGLLDFVQLLFISNLRLVAEDLQQGAEKWRHWNSDKE